jgi:hypothetical protein
MRVGKYKFVHVHPLKLLLAATTLDSCEPFQMPLSLAIIIPSKKMKNRGPCPREERFERTVDILTWKERDVQLPHTQLFVLVV